MRTLIAMMLISSCLSASAQIVNTGRHRGLFTPTGTTNHARQFNGTSDSLQSASPLSSLSGVGTVSLAFWMYWDAFANNDELAFESSANYNSNNGAFLVDPNTSGGGGVSAGVFQYSVNLAGAGVHLDCAFTRPSAAAWHQYVLILDATSGSCGAYVDGAVPSGLTTVNSHTGTFSSQTLNVMSRNNASLFGAGRMSEISVFSGTINSSDASLLAACGRPTSVSSASLLYYWPINQTSPETPTTGGINLTVNGTTNVASLCSF